MQKIKDIILLILIVLPVLLSSCKLNDNSLRGTIGSPSQNSPIVSFETMAPLALIGNSSTIFSFQLTYQNVESVNLLNSYLVLSNTGSVSCDSPNINNPQSLSPSFTIANCTGDGTLKVILSPGTGQSSDGTQVGGAASLEVTIDNTAPTVSVGSPSPASGDSSTNFDFPVTYSNADSINLIAAGITVNDGGGGPCDSPLVTDGSTSTPTVRLSNCTGNGTVGITINASTSSDLAGNENTASVASATVTVSNAISCPAGYIAVPNDGSYTTQDYCVMQFEAKAEIDAAPGTYDADGTGVALGTHTPASVENNQPWRSINRDDAIDECRSLNTEGTNPDIDSDTNGDGTYDLITNNEWQSLAQNIEVQDANWTLGTVGSGCLFQGNNGEANCGYNSGTDPDSGPVGGRNTRAMHVINNGQTSPNNEIWDLAGNVWEWVKDDSTFAYGANAYLNSFGPADGNNGPLGFPKQAFGPLGDYSAHGAGTNYAGLGNGWINYTAGAVLRGGSWSRDTSSGVFAVYLDIGPGVSFTSIGFRCRYTP